MWYFWWGRTRGNLNLITNMKTSYDCKSRRPYGRKAYFRGVLVEVSASNCISLWSCSLFPFAFSEPPTITLKPSLPEIVKNLKESVTVECTAGGTPPVQVTWKKEGVRLDRQKVRRRMATTPGPLDTVEIRIWRHVHWSAFVAMDVSLSESRDKISPRVQAPFPQCTSGVIILQLFALNACKILSR